MYSKFSYPSPPMDTGDLSSAIRKLKFRQVMRYANARAIQYNYFTFKPPMTGGDFLALDLGGVCYLFTRYHNEYCAFAAKIPCLVSAAAPGRISQLISF